MKTITLSGGVEMPLVGYGVYLLTPDECYRCVSQAIATGYRSIDTAQAYYNEEAVGRAVAASGVPRNELFITTKVWISNAGDEAAAAASTNRSANWAPTMSTCSSSTSPSATTTAPTAPCSVPWARARPVPSA